MFPAMKPADIKKRLREVRASQRELATFMDIDFRAVGRIVNGERKRLSQAEVDQIKRFFELREKPVYEQPQGPTGRAGGVSLAESRAEIPLFGGTDTPRGWMITLSASGQLGRVMAHPLQATARRAFAVEVVDDTMSPRLEMSEIVYIYGGQMPRRGQDCLVEFHDMTAQILQFVERTDKRIVLRQFNPGKQVVFGAADNIKLHAIVGRG